ncbi:hypothetical protein HAX54_007578, partial [Datura stramonium]|nr:hypothetical protein [Datura stramonium]
WKTQTRSGTGPETVAEFMRLNVETGIVYGTRLDVLNSRKALSALKSKSGKKE